MVRVELNIAQFILFFIPSFLGTMIGNSIGFISPKKITYKSKLTKIFIATLLGFIIGTIVSVLFFYFWKKSKIVKEVKILKEIDIEKTPIEIKS